MTDIFPEDEAGLRFLFTRSDDGTVTVSSEGDRGRRGDYEASITFPKSLAEQLSGLSLEEVGLVLSYYSYPVMFPYTANDTDEQPEVTSEVTPVVSATFVGQQIKDLKDDIVITLKLDDESYEDVRCVSWSFEANGEQPTCIQSEILLERATTKNHIQMPSPPTSIFRN